MEHDPALATVKTYRYLRVALVGLVGLLLVAVALEWRAGGSSCLQGSISAYFHTPVQSVFVGVLVSAGVCLIALKGNTRSEHVLLNVAGMLAPAVAFIPTTEVGTCRSVPFVVADVPSRVTNNMQALFLAGLLVGAAAAVVARREAGARGLQPGDRWGFAGSAALLVAGAVWFYAEPASFVANAHGFAAVPMFAAVVGVVWLNATDARGSGDSRSDPRPNRYVPVYRMISVLMLLALAGTVVMSLATGSSTVVLWIEVVLLGLFAVFWVIQTTELWSVGLRRPSG